LPGKEEKENLDDAGKKEGIGALLSGIKTSE